MLLLLLPFLKRMRFLFALLKTEDGLVFNVVAVVIEVTAMMICSCCCCCCCFLFITTVLVVYVVVVPMYVCSSRCSM
jgi:hypothetical protein